MPIATVMSLSLALAPCHALPPPLYRHIEGVVGVKKQLSCPIPYDQD